MMLHHKLSPQQTQRNRHLIVGGHNIEPYDRYPYFVSIDKNNGVIVSGALIAPDIVLSAGHVALNHMDNLTLKVGPYAVHLNETFAETIPVVDWLVPPQWKEFLPAFFTQDYLILQLARPSTHSPVRLNRNPSVPHDNQPVIMMGLGWVNENYPSPASIVQEAELVYVNNAVCEAAKDIERGLTYQGKIDDSMLCTKSPPNTTRDGCAWDSGAPVIVAGDKPEDDVLVALGSTGIGCADPVFPAIQARVSTDFAVDWIRQQVCRLSKNPPQDFECDTINATTTTSSAASSSTPSTSSTASSSSSSTATSSSSSTSSSAELVASPTSIEGMLFQNNDTSNSLSSLLLVLGGFILALVAIGRRRRPQQEQMFQDRTVVYTNPKQPTMYGSIEC